MCTYVQTAFCRTSTSFTSSCRLLYFYLIFHSGLLCFYLIFHSGYWIIIFLPHFPLWILQDQTQSSAENSCVVRLLENTGTLYSLTMGGRTGSQTVVNHTAVTSICWEITTSTRPTTEVHCSRYCFHVSIAGSLHLDNNLPVQASLDAPWPERCESHPETSVLS